MPKDALVVVQDVFRTEGLSRSSPNKQDAKSLSIPWPKWTSCLLEKQRRASVFSTRIFTSDVARWPTGCFQPLMSDAGALSMFQVDSFLHEQLAAFGRGRC